jgi:hypothetical protein
MKSKLLNLDPLSRRSFVERMARSAFGLSILPFLPGGNLRADNTKPLPGFGSAKHVILINLVGGMTHIDTFDPKEGDSKGPSAAVSTKAGFQLTGFLPETAKVADKICVIRSMTAKVGVHESAQYLMRTGFEKRGTIVHPMLGAWAQNYLGPSHKTLPSTVCVNRNSGHGNGWMPAGTSPLPILDPDAGLQNSSTSVPPQAMDKRLALLHDLDHQFHGSKPDENVKAYDDFYANTLQLMKSSDLEAFNLNKEDPKTRELYGNSKLGQGCLLARRLVEGGVRFIEVQSGGWDMHKELEGSMEKVGAEFDTAFGALIADLDRRGMLENTLVAVTTEFGRKPQFDGSGRGHHPKGFSCVLAGAGVKRGFVHGATDKTGYEPTSDPMTAGDLHATIGFAMGLPIDKEVISPSGRPFTVGNHGKPALAVFA